MNINNIKLILIPSFWLYMGLCFWSISNQIEPTYSRSFLFLINALTGGFSVYGFITLMANITTSNNWLEFKSKVNNNFKNAFKKPKEWKKNG